MSPLERLGLEVVAYTLLGSRWQAAMLLRLIDAKGQIVSWENLASARAWRNNVESELSTRKSIQVRICLLRQSLDDIGLESVIMTDERSSQIEAVRGYYMPNEKRDAVLTRLIEEAAA